MKKVTQSRLVTIFIILGIAAIIFFSLSSKPKIELSDEEAIACIGEKSTLYVRLGCSHCKTQEEMFGDNIEKINIVDCFYEPEFCDKEGITATPTWKIGSQKLVGVQSIEILRSITRC